MDKWYASTGKLKYSDNGWLVLDISNSIIRYYAWWVQKLEWKKGSTPLHGGHVTIINPNYEDGRHSKFWKFRQGALIRFEYSSVIKTDDKREYFWLTIKSDDLILIRKELGLKNDTPYWPYHATCFFIDRS